MRAVVIIILGLCALFVACEDNDNGAPEIPDYRITIGDTTYIIPAAAVEFAGGRLAPNNFNWDAYMLREYQLATDAGLRYPDPVYDGSISSWKSRPWLERRTFLLNPYDHDINTGDAAEFYYFIGVYPEQFGYGWVDTFNPEADLWNPAGNPWAIPADSTLEPDHPNTLHFDGESNLLNEYLSMWIVE